HNGERFDDDCAKNPRNRVGQGFIGFLAGNGGFFNDRPASSQGHHFAGAAIFLTLKVNEAIAAKRLGASDAPIDCNRLQVVPALHALGGLWFWFSLCLRVAWTLKSINK